MDKDMKLEKILDRAVDYYFKGMEARESIEVAMKEIDKENQGE